MTQVNQDLNNLKLELFRIIMDSTPSEALSRNAELAITNAVLLTNKAYQDMFMGATEAEAFLKANRIDTNDVVEIPNYEGSTITIGIKKDNGFVGGPGTTVVSYGGNTTNAEATTATKDESGRYVIGCDPIKLDVPLLSVRDYQQNFDDDFKTWYDDLTGKNGQNNTSKDIEESLRMGTLRYRGADGELKNFDKVIDPNNEGKTLDDLLDKYKNTTTEAPDTHLGTSTLSGQGPEEREELLAGIMVTDGKSCVYEACAKIPPIPKIPKTAVEWFAQEILNGEPWAASAIYFTLDPETSTGDPTNTFESLGKALMWSFNWHGAEEKQKVEKGYWYKIHDSILAR